ncbi:hypothetical protein FOZ61_003312 [Perkinsus olseni]|uniref:Uncharacterized protein n=1 Tax=Perkinsus olseni TaxID=32597 RepID=A0A7J6MDP3_PEROL|nr:hypothetical protein FOZ61_003312 [Perkinsus olseni]
MHSVPSWATALDQPSPPAREGPADQRYLCRILRRLELNVPQARKVEIEATAHHHTALPRLWLRCLGSALTHNTRCRALRLSGCRLGDDEVRLLCSQMGRWSSLRDLSLDHNNITCKGAHAVFTQLATAPIGGLSLETCDLSFNRVGDSGARRMALTLAQHNSSVGQGLRVLNLRGNRIGDWGAGWLSLVIAVWFVDLPISWGSMVTLRGNYVDLGIPSSTARRTQAEALFLHTRGEYIRMRPHRVVRNLGAAGCSLEVLDVSKNPRITLSGGLAELSMACRQARQTLELDGVVRQLIRLPARWSYRSSQSA